MKELKTLTAGLSVWFCEESNALENAEDTFPLEGAYLSAYFPNYVTKKYSTEVIIVKYCVYKCGFQIRFGNTVTAGCR